MKRNAESSGLRSSRLASRVRVKSGCRTCRIRKIKCDEGRPACQRCLSTGRVCDGYGVWSGGSNSYTHNPSLNTQKIDSVTTWTPHSIPIIAADAEMKQYYDWFQCRTAKKIPGFFVLTFWNTLLLQASVNEPAVLHAILSLSSVHKREIVDLSKNNLPDQQERFTLLHYSKAISFLQPHFASKDKTSIRVALIACVVFVGLEFLRGHFKTAQIHLQNGLNILNKLKSTTNDSDNTDLKPSRLLIDHWIIEAFSRFQLQVVLFNQSCRHLRPVFKDFPLRPPIAKLFYSFNEAWQRMEQLLIEIHYLADQARLEQESKAVSPEHPSLIEHNRRIQEDIAQWFRIFKTSKKILHGQENGEIGCTLLYTFYILTTIMAGACLCVDDESIFDSYTKQFLSLIKQSIIIWKIRPPHSDARARPPYCVNMSRSVVDIIWVPPLYYIAVKCRVHRVRIQAVKLLETTSHREGIWDAKLTTSIARKVIEIEERGFYKHAKDDYSLSSFPSAQDTLLPTLPQSYRIHVMKVVLPNGPMDSAFLFYKQKTLSGVEKMFMKEYHIPSGSWIDHETGAELEIQQNFANRI